MKRPGDKRNALKALPHMVAGESAGLSENGGEMENAEESQVVVQIRQLSAGTIAGLTNLRKYEEIDRFREYLARQTVYRVEKGFLSPDAAWQAAWNLEKAVGEVLKEGA